MWVVSECACLYVHVLCVSVCFYVWILYVPSSTYIFTCHHLRIVGIFFLSFILFIGWQLSIWNCCKPFFSLLYNCQLLFFRQLALSIIVEVFLWPFFRRFLFQGCQYNDCLLAGWSRAWIPMGTIFSASVQTSQGIDHLPPSNAEVKEWVELYLISPSGPSWPVLGWTLPSPFTLPFHHLKINYGHFVSSQIELHMNDSISYFISSVSVFIHIVYWRCFSHSSSLL